MIGSLRQLGMRGVFACACLSGCFSLVALSASAQLGGYSTPHVDVSYPYRNMQPPYPATAVAGGEEGSVILEVLVTPDGKVAQTRLYDSSGFNDLDNAAIAAVMGWKFIPAMRNGEAETDWANVKVDFRLEAAAK
jgi:TonB family protein